MTTFRLVSPLVRSNAINAVKSAPDGWVVEVKEPKRSRDQNAMFHAMCGDLAKSDMKFAGKRRNADEWKMLLVSGHSVATGGGGEVIPGIEGEFVAIRESTARMSVSRAASLLTYVLAFCDTNGVELTETTKAGYLEMMERVNG